MTKSDQLAIDLGRGLASSIALGDKLPHFFVRISGQGTFIFPADYVDTFVMKKVESPAAAWRVNASRPVMAP